MHGRSPGNHSLNRMIKRRNRAHTLLHLSRGALHAYDCRMGAGPILHADADAFAVSVALRSRPEIVEKPVIVVAHACMWPVPTTQLGH